MLTALLVPFAVTAALVATFAFANRYLDPHQRLLRSIRAAPRVSVADATDGTLVRIVGTLRGAGTLVRAPISGRTCAAFHVIVEEGGGKNWLCVAEEREAHEFLVEDASGTALVRLRTKEGDAAIVFDRSGFIHDAPVAVGAFLAARGRRPVGHLGLNHGLRYSEGVLAPGERVAVVGRARWIDDPNGIATADRTADYRAPAQRRRALVLEASELSPVRASDDPEARIA